MKRILSIIAVLFNATILSGSGNKATVWKYELPLSFYGENDSIPTINQFGQVRNGIIVDNIISVYNADPNGVDLTNTQIEAFRMLVGGMYTTGTWQKCKAIYPFIGGSEYKHKWNIKDLRDLDVAYRLTYFGTVTHNTNGIQGDGTTGYANTFLTPSIHLTLNNTHIASYAKRSNFTDSKVNTIVGSATDIGTGGGIMNLITVTNFSLRQIGSRMYENTTQKSNIDLTTSVSLDICFTISNKNSTSSFSVFDRGNKFTFNTLSSVLPNQSLGIMTTLRGGTTPINYSNLINQFISIGSGLTDTEAIRQSNIVTQVQRHLNRQ